jgi:GalNAc-alpha-(1->4)-GalNAc-alpha-(1->3)-diNAcBac-PP-undecaprenol alpha-1,4-N-acetyl-D-galactosaminyltransferase
MKIIILVSSMGNGGAERVASTLANYWAGRGFNVAIVPTFTGRGVCFYELAESIRVIYLSDLLNGRTPYGLVGYLRRVLCLRRLVAEERADSLLSFLPNVSIMTILATLGMRERKIICERTDPFVMPVPWNLSLLRRLLYPLADVLVVQTEAVARKISRFWHRAPEIEIIGNPIPSELSQLPALPKPPGEKTLLAVGRLSEEKGFENLINVFQCLVARHPDWSLRVVGDGPLRGSLETLITEKKLHGKVELVGRVKDIATEYRRADAFVLASRYEGFPNALLEAMASGLACVSVDCPSGPYEITDRGRAAVLVSPNDANALVEGLSTIMADEGRRYDLSRRGREFVAERFRLDVIAERWEATIMAK